MLSSATMPAAASMPAWRRLPPSMRRKPRARVMNSLVPQSSEPTGALKPFETQKVTLSVWRVMCSAGTPSAIAALNSRAPSVCTGMPCFRPSA
jgi:hypothetical protein